MPRTTRTLLPSALAEAARRFEDWRRRRTKRVIPPQLWRRATELARRYGVSATSNALRLDYYELRRRVSVPPRSSPAAAFVEITPAPAPSSSPSECTVELEDVHGTKLRFHLKGLLARELSELAERLLGPRE